MSKGWTNESARHSMSRYGIKTGRKQKVYAYSDASDSKKHRILALKRMLNDYTFEGNKKVVKKELNELLNESVSKKPAWQREIDARIKKGNGFEEISDNVLTNYPKLDNWAGREKIEKYYNKQYAKSDVQAGWF